MRRSASAPALGLGPAAHEQPTVSVAMRDTDTDQLQHQDFFSRISNEVWLHRWHPSARDLTMRMHDDGTWWVAIRVALVAFPALHRSHHVSLAYHKTFRTMSEVYAYRVAASAWLESLRRVGVIVVLTPARSGRSFFVGDCEAHELLRHLYGMLPWTCKERIFRRERRSLRLTFQGL